MARKQKKRWKKILILSVIVIVIGGLFVANALKEKDTSVEVQTVKVKKGELVETVPGTGRVQPEVQVSISANVSGKITGIFVEEGDRVEKGSLLVTLDREKYEAAAEQAQSSLKSSKAAMAKSESELRRARELFQQSMSSQADLEAAEADFQLRSAEVERSAAYLKQAKDDLAKTSIYSPMAGIVSLLNKEPGEMALGAQFQQDIIMVVADLSKMEVVVEIDESDIINVSLQDTAEIEIDAYPDTVFSGIVREIAHTATTRGMGTAEEITNFEVKVTILEVPDRLRPGMSATAEIVTEVHEDALYIPIQCVVLKPPLMKDDHPSEGEEPVGADTEEEAQTTEPDEDIESEKKEPIEVVFVVRDGVVEQIPVITGISSDTDLEILSGLEKGEIVVSGPFRTLTQQLKDGDEVRKKEKPKGRGDRRRGQNEGADPDLMDEM